MPDQSKHCKTTNLSMLPCYVPFEDGHSEALSHGPQENAENSSGSRSLPATQLPLPVVSPPSESAVTFREHMWEGHVSCDVHCVLTVLPSWYSLQLYPQPPELGQKTLHANMSTSARPFAGIRALLLSGLSFYSLAYHGCS